MSRASVFAVVLAGGTGTRLWPASRRDRPKHLLRIAGDRTLLVETLARLEGCVPAERTLVVTTREQVDLVRAALPAVPASNLIVEPDGRNTGPCLALAAAEIRRREPNSVQIVLPADHVIRPREAFQGTLRRAIEAAAGGRSLLVFGIRPTAPATAFGWIRAGDVERTIDGVPLHQVERFVEKPDLARAREFLAHGGYFWNSGMFAWSTEAISNAFAEHLPVAWSLVSRELSPQELAREYARLEAVSIDVAVLERSNAVRMLPVDYFWSDVGSWDALATVAESGEQGNVADGGGALTAIDSRGCIVHAEPDQLVALVGVEDLIVVHSRGATLVCRKDRAQDVKQLVDRLRREQSGFL